MLLSKRLQTISDLIDNNQVVADIGCDHGQLACSLIQNGKSPYVYACDINQKPLDKARQLANDLNISDQVKLVLSDGIKDLGNDVNTFVIAGMGFDTIKHILDQGSNQLKDCEAIIVQANNDLIKIRTLISDNSWKILDERIVFEGKHYYQLIKFTPRGGKKLTDKEKLFGKMMPKDQIYEQFWHHQLEKQQKIRQQVTPDSLRYQEVSALIKLIEEELYELHN